MKALVKKFNFISSDDTYAIRQQIRRYLWIVSKASPIDGV